MMTQAMLDVLMQTHSLSDVLAMVVAAGGIQGDQGVCYDVDGGQVGDGVGSPKNASTRAARATVPASSEKTTVAPPSARTVRISA